MVGACLGGVFEECLGDVWGMFWGFLWGVSGMFGRYLVDVSGMDRGCFGDVSGMFWGCFGMFEWRHGGPSLLSASAGPLVNNSGFKHLH